MTHHQVIKIFNNLKIPIMLSIASLLCYFILSYKPNDDACIAAKKELMPSFKGVITKKYVDKMFVLQIRINNKINIVRRISHSLYNNANIGDSIIKLGGQNIAVVNGQSYDYLVLIENCPNLEEFY